MSSKRILVTGAAGFIGFHVAKYLEARGDAVIGLDNFNDYYPPQLKRKRARKLADEGVSVVEGDICESGLLQALTEKNEIGHIVHLAAQAGVRYSLINPQIYLKANIDGFLNVLETCRQAPSIALTYASSSSVYGLNVKTPFSVGDRTDSQASLYGVTKKTNELMASAYHHLYGFPVTGLRFFTVYGPWGRPDMAYYSFTKAVMEDKEIDVYNFGKMSRDFTYIDDIVDGIVAAIDLRASCEIFNLGHHHSEPLSSLIAIIEENLHKSARIRYMPMQAGDVESTCADIVHSQEKLGFAPKVSLSEGMREFIEWYKEHGTEV